MGCGPSKTPKISSELDKVTRKSATENKIAQALLKKKLEQVVAEKPMSFEKILLKFDKLRVVLGYVKTIYHEFSTEGKLDHNGLLNTFKRMDVNMSLQEILDLFDFIDVQAANVVTFKEFLVALTIGQVLDVIPALSATPAGGVGPNGKKPVLKRSVSGFLGHNHEIKEMLNLIVSAYLLFDSEGKGFIERSTVEKKIEESGHKAGGNAMLSQQRWSEMDWDANGTIDFAEFVFAFASWVDLDEE